ncbi:hypothetical protein AB0P12_32600 [Streptomyces subrutilus]|uniref:hypothetical protein n=1 Tax=Streptomyces subrutilus TaxID=36818 RepID=UPI0033D54A26
MVPGRLRGPVAALRRNDGMRRPAVNAIVLANLDLGPEGAIARAEELGGGLPEEQAQRITTRYRAPGRATVARVDTDPSRTVPVAAADRKRLHG